MVAQAPGLAGLGWGASPIGGAPPSGMGPKHPPPDTHIRSAVWNTHGQGAGCSTKPWPTLGTTDSYTHFTNEEAEAESLSHRHPKAELGFQQNGPGVLKTFRDSQTGVCGEREKRPGNATAGATTALGEGTRVGKVPFFKITFCVVSFTFYVLCSRSWYFYLTGEEADVKLLPKATQTLS